MGTAARKSDKTSLSFEQVHLHVLHLILFARILKITRTARRAVLSLRVLFSRPTFSDRLLDFLGPINRGRHLRQRFVQEIVYRAEHVDYSHIATVESVYVDDMLRVVPQEPMVTFQHDGFLTWRRRRLVEHGASIGVGSCGCEVDGYSSFCSF